MADRSVFTSIEKAEDLTPFDRMTLEIKLAERNLERFHQRGDKLISKYRIEDAYSYDGDLTRGSNPYHVYWSNVQTTQPALYSSTPKPHITRRYKDRDIVGRVAAEIAERAATFMIKAEDFDDKMRSIVNDLLIPGLGQCWVSYKPQFVGKGEEKELAFAHSRTVYQYWKDFLWSPTRQWEHVRWVAKKLYMSHDECEERWKGRAENLSYDHAAHKADDYEELKDKELFKKACIYELWDKKTRSVYWFDINDSKQDFLEQKKDFLRVQGFFPCPRPLLATTTTSTLVPIADYDMYAEQAELLRDIQIQIDYLVRATKVAGVYDKNCSEIQQLLSDDVRNEMLPADNWPLLQQQGGLKGASDFLDITAISNALAQLYDAQSRTLARMYEVTGISDIIRGQGNPYETAEAQRTKAQYATLRLQNRQKEVQRFARDIIRLHTEIIVEHMDADMLRLMTGVDFMTEFTQQPEQAEQLYRAAVDLLRKDKLRSFRIDIETDSTISPDRQAEKQQRVELLTAIGQFLQSGLAVGSQEPALVPAMGEMLLYGVRGFEGGRDLESTLEQATDSIKQKLQNPEPPPPDPALLKVQQDGELKGKELELKAQELQLQAKELEIKMFEAQLKAKEIEAQYQLDAIRIKGALQVDNTRVQKEVQEASTEAQLKAAQIKQAGEKMAADAQIAAARVQQDNYKIHNEAVKLSLKSKEVEQGDRKIEVDAAGEGLKFLVEREKAQAQEREVENG